MPNLKFFRNGAIVHEACINRVRGEVFPAVSVRDGAEVEATWLQRIEALLGFQQICGLCGGNGGNGKKLVGCRGGSRYVERY